jgi:mono/diheme cytochrome c family protein
MSRIKPIYLIAAVVLVGAIAGCARKSEEASGAMEEVSAFTPTSEQEALAAPPAPIAAQAPDLNARRGRILFVAKGCVICHQVNGVGGEAAPDLSAGEPASEINPLDFSARMWRGAPAMTALQTIELGYVIDLDAQDIADLAAFAASKDEQALLTLSSVGEGMREWFLNEPHWRSGEWTEYLKRGDRIPGLEEENP